jgi:hypothetical protein
VPGANQCCYPRISAEESDSTEKVVGRLAAVGLVADEAHRLRPDALADLEPISMIQESCTVFNAAFLLLLAIWSVVGGIIWMRGRRRPTGT